VAKQTRMSEFYLTLLAIFRELTLMPMIEVESPVEAHDIVFIDESQLGTILSTPHIRCYVSLARHNTLRQLISHPTSYECHPL
jgi:hypothetical protein